MQVPFYSTELHFILMGKDTLLMLDMSDNSTQQMIAFAFR